MAILKTFRCTECGKEKTESISLNDCMLTEICQDCKNQDATKRRSDHFAELDKLSIDDRVRKIEEWMYDYRPPRTRSIVFR